MKMRPKWKWDRNVIQAFTDFKHNMRPEYNTDIHKFVYEYGYSKCNTDIHKFVHEYGYSKCNTDIYKFEYEYETNM